MARIFANRVLVGSATTGTGTLSLGSPFTGYQSFSDGGVANGDTVRYLLIDGTSFEIGIGTYSSTGPTLSRDTVEESTEAADAKLDLSGAAQVAIIASAADYTGFVSGPASAADNQVAVYDGATGRLLKAVASLPVAQGGTGGTNQTTARTGLGLGTAATATVTTSATDTTAERLLRVGAGHQQLDATLYRRGNILGTVSESGGVPTGAIIERGSNANGEFVRFADGTQICWKEIVSDLAINVAFQGGFRSVDVTWTFPATFTGVRVVSAIPVSLAAPGITSRTFGSSTLIDLNYYSFASQPEETRRMRALAVGRWFSV